MGRAPSFPEVGSETYNKLVSRVESYGWPLGVAVTGLNLATSQSTLDAWKRKAEAGTEPYASWMPRFWGDVRALRQRHLSYLAESRAGNADHQVPRFGPMPAISR